MASIASLPLAFVLGVMIAYVLSWPPLAIMTLGITVIGIPTAAVLGVSRISAEVEDRARYKFLRERNMPMASLLAE